MDFLFLNVDGASALWKSVSLPPAKDADLAILQEQSQEGLEMFSTYEDKHQLLCPQGLENCQEV